MKRLAIFATGIVLLFAATVVFAQQHMDMSQEKTVLSPPATESTTISGKAITINYSSPRVRGRAGHLFGKDGLISKDPTYPIWRAGANAATKLHTETDLTLGNLTVPKGDYTLYVDISDPTNWVLVVSKQTGQWGMSYDKSQDLGRVPLATEKLPSLVESLKYTLKDQGDGKGKLTLAWENLSGSVAVTVHSS